jgi:hypothetical protein
MDAPPSIPFRAAAAYGAPRPALRPDAASLASAEAADREPTLNIRSRRTDRVDISPPAPGIERLVGGTVRSDINRGVGFDGDISSAPPSGTTSTIRPTPTDGAPLQFYNRHADRLEAAVDVALGRTLDIQA